MNYNKSVSGESLNLGNLKVLVVEDDPNIQAQLAFHLRSQGYLVDTAEDGDIALEKIEESAAYDLIVLDIMMPRVSGLDVCRTVRQNHNLFELPILITSALSESQDVVTGLNTGANDYITKPFQRVELLARVKNLLSLKQMTDLARANERLATNRALFDELTGLPNRYSLDNRLQEIIGKARKEGTALATIFINLDRFKSINNSMGHGVGDIYLRELAQRLREISDNDDIVTRLYTDTFAIIKSDIVRNGNEQALVGAFAQKILNTVNDPIVINHYELKRTASVGIAMYPEAAATASDLLRFADSAMYYAKSKGGNVFIFHSLDIHISEKEKFALERRLKSALKNGEFVLAYQPQVSLSDESIVGVEALIRWNDPKKGLISPTKFIPVAEETGMIIPLSEWVLETALVQSKKWQEQGFGPVRVGVNLSPRHFHQPGLLKHVEKVLDSTAISPEHLELEITEGTIMSNVEQAISTLNAIRGLGVGLSVDDFGTGYSSLNYLKRFPIQTLKIDRSFISLDFFANQQEAAIVNSIIKLGHSLNLNVIAEGVETAVQRDYLKNNYCNEIQGFYFSKPVTGEEITGLLRKE